jgi:hypothetical protein
MWEFSISLRSKNGRHFHLQRHVLVWTPDVEKPRYSDAGVKLSFDTPTPETDEIDRRILTELALAMGAVERTMERDKRETKKTNGR